MSFKSQVKESKVSSRRGSTSLIVVSQTFKPSTKSEEFSVRVASTLLKKVGLEIGGRADVLYDASSDRWMIKSSADGFTITGQKGAPTGLVRYTLKTGHDRLTKERSELPVRIESDDESLEIYGDHVIFKLKR